MNDTIENSTVALAPAQIETAENPTEETLQVPKINPELKDCALAQLANAQPSSGVFPKAFDMAKAALMLSPQIPVEQRALGVFGITRQVMGLPDETTKEELFNYLLSLARAGKKQEFEEFLSELRPAMRLLFNAHIHQSNEEIHRFVVDDYEFFIKPLAWPDLTAVWADMPRDAFGFCDFQNSPGIRRFSVTLLSKSLVNSENDSAPLFDEEAATEFVDSPGAADWIERLFAEISVINPTLFPKPANQPHKPTTAATSST